MQAETSPIGIAGAGAVARAFGRLLNDLGEPVVIVASRTREHAEDAARFIGPRVRSGNWPEIAERCDRLIIATADRAITPVAEALAAAGFRNGVALHTSGARGPEALEPLRRTGTACGVLH